MLDQIADSPRSRLLRLVEQLLVEESGVAESGARAISADDSLTELGVGSIGMVSLMLNLEAEFDIMIPQAEITLENFRSIATIEALVGRLAA